MIKDLATRAWRLGLAVGPIVGVALVLVAGVKWR
jgi:hypothetical protein